MFSRLSKVWVKSNAYFAKHHKEAKPRRGWTRGSVPARTLGSEGGWIGGSHVNGGRERVSASHWVPNTSIGEENEAFFIRVWKPLPSRHVLKTLRRNPKGKAQRGQYRLAVGLGCYSNILCNIEEHESIKLDKFFRNLRQFFRYMLKRVKLRNSRETTKIK